MAFKKLNLAFKKLNLNIPFAYGMKAQAYKCTLQKFVCEVQRADICLFFKGIGSVLRLTSFKRLILEIIMFVC